MHFVFLPGVYRTEYRGCPGAEVNIIWCGYGKGAQENGSLPVPGFLIVIQQLYTSGMTITCPS